MFGDKGPAAQIQFSAIQNSTTGLAKTAQATSIESFKINIHQVQIHKDVVMNGSGYESLEALELYNGPVSGAEYPNFNAARARASDNGFIDFVNPASLSNFTGSTAIDEELRRRAEGTSSDSNEIDTFHNAGIYRYVSVGFMRPFKIKGVVHSITGEDYYTKDGVASGEEGSSTIASTPLTTAPAEEAVVMKNNGGTVFRLLKPLIITKQDIIDTAIFRILLVFNADGFLSAYNSNVTDGGAGGITDALGNVIKVPFLDIVPVAFRDGQRVVKETYLFTEESQPRSYVQLELCTVLEDSTNVYGVSLRGVTKDSSQLPAEFQTVRSVVETDGKLTFSDWAGTMLVGKFVRLNNVNDVGVADIGHGPNVSANVSYTLIAKNIIN
jgi:hypothetical protein